MTERPSETPWACAGCGADDPFNCDDDCSEWAEVLAEKSRVTVMELPVTQKSVTEAVAGALSPFGGYLRCETCRYERPLGDTGYHLTVGWPICCGQTMRWWTQRQIDAGEVPA